MNTFIDKVLPVYEKVVHIAFGCACVRSFHVEQLTMVNCPIHGDPMISSTEELVPKQLAS